MGRAHGIWQPIVLVTGLAACTATGDAVHPAEDTVFYPTGMVVAPDDSVAFVANANSDLRYDSGSVVVLELDVVDQVVSSWLAGDPGDCIQDADRLETLVCNEAKFIRDRSGVRVGNFATDMALQDRGGGAARLIVPTRGDPSIAWIDWDGTRLSCSASSGDNTLCDDAHRLTAVHGDSDVASLPSEPFGVFADSASDFAIVTHLTDGSVTLIDSPRAGNAQIADVLTGVFQGDPTLGLPGATGVVGRTPNAAGDIVYVSSRTDDRIQTFTVGRPVNAAPPFLLAGEYFILESVGETSGESKDSRGMAFSPTGETLYVVNRRPPSLQFIDTSIGQTGNPINEASGAVDICRQGSTVSVADTGDGERAYVSCFQDGQIYVVDPRGLAHVEDIILVGRGPYSVVSAPTRKKLYVTNFLEDTIAVVDIAPGSATRNRVVLRIGEPRPPGEQ
ncbi:MAG: YncE family protein [Kofleriaceae bacterium]